MKFELIQSSFHSFQGQDGDKVEFEIDRIHTGENILVPSQFIEREYSIASANHKWDFLQRSMCVCDLNR